MDTNKIIIKPGSKTEVIEEWTGKARIITIVFESKEFDRFFKSLKDIDDFDDPNGSGLKRLGDLKKVFLPK